MSTYPVTDPTNLEKMLFDAGLVVKLPLAEIYDIKASTSIQQTWQNPEIFTARPDVFDPSQWDDKLHACMRGEFFAHVLKDCQRVLDIGTGEGWPSLYIAHTIPEVVGLDLSPKHIALARSSATLMGLDNVQFEVAHIEALCFPNHSFDGVCFGGNVFTYGFDPQKMLSEIHRVLRAGGVFALEQWPVDPNQPVWERILWFIDGGPPILHYGAGSGLRSRSYFIYLKPDSKQGKRLADLASRMSGELTGEQRRTCEQIKRDIENGTLDIVEKAIYSGEDRSLAADEFPLMLESAGFTDFACWALPDAVVFAKSLNQDGVLSRLLPKDLIPCLRALVKSSRTCSKWVHPWVTCRKK